MKQKQLPYILIDGPSPFDSLETWERFLAEVQAMPDFVTKQMEIRSAKWMPMMQRDRALTCLFKDPIRVSEKPHCLAQSDALAAWRIDLD